MPHGNDPTAFCTGCPNHHDTPPVQIPGRDETVLVIVEPEILNGRAPALKHLTRIGKVEAPILQGLGSLRRIEADVLADSCIPD
jgi:hypothetical protein